MVRQSIFQTATALSLSFIRLFYGASKWAGSRSKAEPDAGSDDNGNSKQERTGAEEGIERQQRIRS